MQLSEYVGQTILIRIPRLESNGLIAVNLLDIDRGGIWIENEKLAKTLLKNLGVSSVPRTPVFFVPYQEISFCIGYIEKTHLDEEALGA